MRLNNPNASRITLPRGVEDVQVQPKSLTKDQIDNLIDLVGCAGRLEGRPTMLPITGKAFFEGRLMCGGSQADVSSETLFVVNETGKLVEMSRGETNDYYRVVRGRFDTRIKIKKRSSTSRTDTSQKSGDSLPHANETKQTVLAGSSTGLPMMEIRETFDSDGNIVDAEMFDMTRTEDRLRSLNSETNDGKKFVESIAKSLQGIQDDSLERPLHPLHSPPDGEETATVGSASAVSKTQRKVISDEEYDALTKRLEELEILEEADTKAKKQNRQSSGWSKGFLNAKSSRKKKRAPKPEPVENNHPKSLPRNNTKGEGKQNKVSFSDTNETKEIPLIGKSKVPPRPPPGRSVNEEVVNGAELASTELPHMPFDETVFRDVVQERGVAPNALSEASRKSEEPKKRLSRFAQRRLERNAQE
ncbi:hypothetical protein THAOC_02462 [Thalassiosira oceanica]|uniref:Uncharacterized protein n=1 Tax=Thalassiosira oceanica TaxID=159749 RepID=K0TQC4_THAOC|nr:hypothetical protein THAOC_02462 [Thalassiosira oceanica]|eukprot:EJK75802.1 hypothetical protein THAOC_02462 [Thalassiosira oceanica]